MEHFGSFLMFCIAASITPGPNNLMLLSSAMNFGIAATLPHLMGVTVGMTIFSLLMAGGLGALCSSIPMLRQGIQIAGAFYILYLSWQIATSHTSMRKKSMRKPLTFIQSFLFQWVNPKAWVLMMSAMSAYVSLSGTNPYLELLIVGLTRFLIITLCCGLWVLGGAKLKFFFTHDRYQVWFNYFMGSILALSTLPLFF